MNYCQFSCDFRLLPRGLCKNNILMQVPVVVTISLLSKKNLWFLSLPYVVRFRPTSIVRRSSLRPSPRLLLRIIFFPRTASSASSISASPASSIIARRIRRLPHLLLQRFLTPAVGSGCHRFPLDFLSPPLCGFDALPKSPAKAAARRPAHPCPSPPPTTSGRHHRQAMDQASATPRRGVCRDVGRELGCHHGRQEGPIRFGRIRIGSSAADPSTFASLCILPRARCRTRQIGRAHV